MNPILFQLAGVLAGAQYVPGQYQWPFPVRLTGGVLTCQAPSPGSALLELELGGVLSGYQVAVHGPASEIVQALVIEREVPAYTRVRWRVVSAPEPESSLGRLAITMQVSSQGADVRGQRSAVLTVRWRHGNETFPLFTYDAATHGFTESSAGISAGRAAFYNYGTDEQLQIWIEGTPALRVQGGTLWVRQLIEGGTAVTDGQPALEFWVDQMRVASLTKSGALRTAHCREEAPLAAEDSGGRFVFYSAQFLSASLSRAGLVAAGIQEEVA